jgi:hypothetical protein
MSSSLSRSPITVPSPEPLDKGNIIIVIVVIIVFLFFFGFFGFFRLFRLFFFGFIREF